MKSGLALNRRINPRPDRIKLHETMMGAAAFAAGSAGFDPEVRGLENSLR